MKLARLEGCGRPSEGPSKEPVAVGRLASGEMLHGVLSTHSQKSPSRAANPQPGQSQSMSRPHSSGRNSRVPSAVTVKSSDGSRRNGPVLPQWGQTFPRSWYACFVVTIESKNQAAIVSDMSNPRTFWFASSTSADRAKGLPGGLLAQHGIGCQVGLGASKLNQFVFLNAANLYSHDDTL